MTPRLKKLSEGIDIVRKSHIPISVKKARLITESLRRTEGKPTLIRSAIAFAHVVEHATIFINDQELLVGNPASQPWGVEITHLWGTWPEDELESLERDGYQIKAEDRKEILELNKYWEGRTLTARMTELYDDEVLWPFAQAGIVLPSFKSKEEGWGAGGLIGGGYGVHHEISNVLATPDIEKVMKQGLNAIIADAEAELAATRLNGVEAIRKADFLRAALIALPAVIRLAERFSNLATEMADTAIDPVRRDELRLIAEICNRVPAEPARDFREAMQSYWFIFLVMLPSGTLGMGRLDQVFYPWYRQDKKAGTITDEQVVELFAMLRLRSMEITIQGSSAHRNKWAGGSKWHNCTIGGQTRSGADATNELSYLIMDAALACPTPHHTLTMRVHEGTPSSLLRKGLEVVRTGLGMPAFIGDPSMINYLLTKGIDMPDARDYNMSGSMNVTLTGASRLTASPMFLLPRVLIIAMNGGEDPRDGRRFGPQTRPIEAHDSFEEFMETFKIHLAFFLKCQAEFNNVTIFSVGDCFPRPIDSVLMKDALKVGCDVMERTLPYDNSNHVNPIGIVNTADSLAAIRQLVFEKKAVDGAELRQALKDNWAGERGAEIRRLCLTSPKFGNDDDHADLLAADLFEFMAEQIMVLPNMTGGRCNPSALAIGTSPWPGGAVTGATPDGRAADEPLAEEALTPMRDREQHGPWEVIASSLKVDQLPYQVVELDMNFSRSALVDEEALDDLEDMLRFYFRSGGKHIQFNVYDIDELQDAMAHPENHENLIVRLGGTSAYFMQLSPDLQTEMIKRSQFTNRPGRQKQ
ncbi:pyruvate formate lyase family protein [Thermodesulfobacteriota bacterium]